MFTAAEISKLLGTREPLPFPEAKILTISTDSRQITDGTGVCFVALKGLRSDGHSFLRSAWEKGVRNFIVGETASTETLAQSNLFRVADTVKALQQLAAGHRRKFDLKCIGITGSNGKTWVKEWLYQLLTPEHFIVKSPRSYNSQIGAPLSVLQIRKAHTLGIFEAGISLRGEMQRLAEVVKPEIGILTHIGDAHQAGFPSMEDKLVEKLQLFRDAQSILYCPDEPWVDAVIRRECSEKKRYTWSRTHRESDLFICDLTVEGTRTVIHYVWQGQENFYVIPYTDQASVRNSIMCCLLLLCLGYDAAVIMHRMAGLHPIAMRLAIHHLPGNSVLINDAYSLDMGSLAVALETLKQHSAGMSRTVIISDIDSQHAGSYENIAKLFAQHEVNHVLAIGNDIAELGTLLPEGVSFQVYGDTQRFVAATPWRPLMPGAFLLKGARSFHFEQLAEQMQGRFHSAILEIDLNVLLSNLQFFMSKLHAGTKVIAMVKAAAYGSGGAEIARFLAFHNVAMLAVAYMDEGIELREGGVTIPILVMNPDPDRIDQLYRYQLEPEVYDLSLLQAIVQYGEGDGRGPCQVHIKVDTGMHRLGFHHTDAAGLADYVLSHPVLHVASVFTHLAASGEPAEKAFTLRQLDVFNTFYESFCERIGYRPVRHVLNTSGVLGFPEYQYEAVRLGIGLYGAGMSQAGDQLQPVHTLKARLSQVHEIAGGDSVGYDRAFIAETPMRIGTINIGYADGLRRCAGMGRYAVIIRGREARILGKVCMDMAMVDLSAHPDACAGDEVLIFGPGHPVDELARVCDTNAYEILTGISQRVTRVFLYS